MADPEPDTGLIDRPEISLLQSDNGIIETDQIQGFHGTVNEEILQQNLVDEGNDFDSSSVPYSVATADGRVPHTSNRAENGQLDLNRIPLVHSLGENTQYPVQSEDSFPNEQQPIHDHNSQTNYVAQLNGPKSNLPNVTSSEKIMRNEPQTLLTLNNAADRAYMASLSDQLNRSTPQSHHAQPETVKREDTIISQQSVDVKSMEHSSLDVGLIGNANMELSDAEDIKPQIEDFPQQDTVKASVTQGVPLSQDALQSAIEQSKTSELSSTDKCSENTQGTTMQNNSVSFTLVSPNQQNANAPLGSSQNPIRIIQQGNRYTPVQQLTPDQLQQIMQVVRQQHVNKNAQDNGGTVIFNPVTNTKIMYRVIYPSELHKSQIPETTYKVVRPSTLSQEQQTSTPHQKRAYRKRRDASSTSAGVAGGGEDDKDKGGGDSLELSKEEKEERKKHRPRTRSGRVSKPPKHMVQDYKQLHVLDWDEDYDDSDGGYSDFKHSDEEGKTRKAVEEENEDSQGLFQGLGSGKPKNYKCQTCEKSYIGQAGLARHYRLNPIHIKSESETLLESVNNKMLDGEDSSKDASINQDGCSSRASDPGQDFVKTNGIENFSEDSNTQDSLNSNGAISPIVSRGRGRGVQRGRWAHLKHNAQMRKKNKLREFTKRCSDEDLMEVVFPRLVGSISTWEFLMMKSEKGGSRPQVDIIYKEFEGLHRHVKQVCKDYMKSVSMDENQNGNSNLKTVTVQDETLAACLDLEVGKYHVEEMLPDDSNSFSSLHNKISAANISLMSEELSAPVLPERHEIQNNENECGPLKRKFISTSISDVGPHPFKKQKLSTSSSISTSSNHGHIITTLVDSNADIKKEIDIEQNSSELKVRRVPEATTSPSSLLIRGTNVSSTTLSSIVSTKPTTPILPQLSKVEKSTVSSVSFTPVSHSQPSISYLITAPHSKTAAPTNQAQKSQFVPLVLNPNLGSASTSSSQVLPVIFSPKNTVGMNPQPTVMVAAPSIMSNKPIHSNAMPIVLAAPGSQIPGNSMVIASNNTGTGQHVLIRQSLKNLNESQPQQQKTKVILAPHSSNSTTKSPLSLLGSALTTPGSHKSTPSRMPSNMKPAEVKVSRRLFNEATASSALLSSQLQQTSSLISTNGHGEPSNITQPKIKQEFVKDFTKEVSPLTNLEAQKVPAMPLQSNSSMSNNITEMNDPQFISGGVNSGGDEDMDTSFDISAGVLGSIGFSGDELTPLNNSSSSSVLLSSTNLTSNSVTAMVNEMTSSSHISNNIPLTFSKAPDVPVLSSDNTACTSDLSLMNGARNEFSEISPPSATLKDSIIVNSPLVSTSNFMTSVTYLINPPAKPSSPLMSSPSKDNLGLNTVSSVSFNLPAIDSSETLTSQILKSEGSPAILNDLESLNFSDQTNLQSTEQLGGVTTVLQGHGVVNILPEQISTSYESADSLLQAPNTIAYDELENVTSTGEEDGQLLLTEGSIYQTDEGMLVIQSSDGNRYQLTSTQGFPLEAVQALVSGNFGELNGDGINDGTLQTDIHL